MSTILVVEDEVVMREELSEVLTESGHRVLAAQDGEAALEQLKSNAVQLVISDLRLPKIDGLEVLRRAHEVDPGIPFIMMTAFGTVESAIQAMRMGAVDYLVKPLAFDEVLTKVNRIIENAELAVANKMLRRDLDRKLGSLEMVGTSPALDSIRALIQKVAPTRSAVLITGESGTGKELIARAIHALGSPRNEPFVPVNCAAIPEQLLESELFGHQRGSFTGAVSDTEGLFRSARKGTLFLDEIGELPLSLQAKLLRVLEDKRVQPVGSNKSIPFEARIVAATNRHLRAETDKNRFREDLYFRLAVLELHAPPLRDRRDDIPLLAAHFIQRFNRELNRTFTGIEAGAMNNLVSASWKGNIRELQNVIERAMIVGTEPLLQAQDLLPTGRPPIMPVAEMKDLKDAVAIFERDHIRRIIAERHGDKRAAARDLGISLSSLYRHLDLKGPV